MFMLNGSPLPIDVTFRDSNGTQYPANWLRLATLAQKEAIGITEVADPAVVDQRYYWSAGNPKPLEEIKAMRIQEIKTQAFNLLLRTDWRVIKAIEEPPEGAALTAYQEVLAARAAIRTASNVAEAAINACETVDAVALIPAASLVPVVIP